MYDRVLREGDIQNILQCIVFWNILFLYMERDKFYHISSIKAECKLLKRKK